jgi:hypothetical protein
MMPIQKSKFLLKVVLSDPKVSLVKDSNEVAISSPIYVTAPAGIKGSGSAKLQGSISYEAKSGEFFLKNPKIVEFQVNTLPQKYQQQAKLVVQAATENVLAKRSIYQFKDENLKQKLAKSILKSVTVKDQTMWIELGVL